MPSPWPRSSGGYVEPRQIVGGVARLVVVERMSLCVSDGKYSRRAPVVAHRVDSRMNPSHSQAPPVIMKMLGSEKTTTSAIGGGIVKPFQLSRR